LIDVKEPDRGALGRADDAVIGAVVSAVRDVPVSAALGELMDGDLPLPPHRLDLVKWGLAGARAHDWRGRLLPASRRVDPGGLERPEGAPHLVVVAYADAEKALAPPVAEVVRFVCGWPGPRYLLVDTFDKSPPRQTLLDHLTLSTLAALVDRCRTCGVKIALAGSLGPGEIETLRPLRPDWFAVRGAACVDADRGGTVDEARVRALVTLLGRSAG
jgi:uncharacterized protein (UPF0264 family)